MKLKSLLPLFLIMVSLSLFSQNYVLTNEDIDIENGMIVFCNELSSEYIEIPNEIDGQIIKGISDPLDGEEGGVFSSKNIKTIKFPESIEYIGSYAFTYNDIDSIDFSLCTNLDSIGQNAFGENPIKSVDFSNCLNLVKIGEYVFCATNLEQFQLPGTNGEQWQSHFEPYVEPDKYQAGDLVSGCSADYYFKRVRCDDGVCIYTLTDSDVILKSSWISQVISSIDGLNMEIPDTLQGVRITTIYGYASRTYGVFSSKGLIGVKLPQSLQSIPNHCFYDNEIDSIDISNLYSLVSIGANAFAENNMEYFTLPDSTNFDGFDGWKDENGILYESGDTVRDLTLKYEIYRSNVNVTIRVRGDYEETKLIINDTTIIFKDFTTLYNFPNGVYPYMIETDGYLTIIDTLIVAGENEFIFQTPEKIPYELINYDVEVEDGFITLFYGVDNESSIIIPDTLHGQKIIGISDPGSWGYGIFANKDLKKVQFPSDLRYIGTKAFYDNDLGEIDLSNCADLISIGENAFANNIINSLILPTQSNLPEFRYWIDSGGNQYNFNESFNNLTSSLLAAYHRSTITVTLDKAVSLAILKFIDQEFSITQSIEIKNLDIGEYPLQLLSDGYEPIYDTLIVDGTDFVYNITMKTTSNVLQSEKIDFVYHKEAKLIELVNNGRINSVAIYDLSGKLMLNRKNIHEESIVLLNTENLSKGTYSLIIFGNKKKQFKLVID